MMREQQAQFELEKSQGRFLTTRQRMALQRKLAAQPIAPKPDPRPVPKFTAQPAKISLDNAKDTSPSLDGLPTNLRQLIFRFAEEEIKQGVPDWKSKQTSAYNSLKLVSKQFYHDLQDMHWQHWLVRQNQTAYLLKLPFFSDQFSLTRPDRASPLFKKFTSLSLEVSFGTSNAILKNMTLALLALPLIELKLYFTGSDTFGTKTKMDCCGLKAGQTEGKLPVDGQDFRRRAILLNTLGRFENLETLVISNANMPVTPSQIINNKPYLKRLAVLCDPRTTVTDDWSAALNNEYDENLQYATAGSTAPLDSDNMPALHELEISANAMLLTSRLVREAIHTLRKLTWMVPNIANQSPGLPDWHLNWLSQTAEILLVGAMNGPRHFLETLRICIEQPILETDPNRQDRNPMDELKFGLKDYLKRMVSVKNLELHINIPDSQCDVGIETVQNVSHRLERLYISEKMVKGEHMRLIRCLVWTNFGSLVYTEPQLMCPNEEREAARKDLIRYRKQLAFLGYEFEVGGVLYRIVETSEDEPIEHKGVEAASVEGESTHKVENAGDEISMIIDEGGFGRMDEALSLGLGYDAHREIILDRYSNTADVAIELLRLNGRLLDRERNKHLFVSQNVAGAQVEVTEGDAVAPGARPARRFPVIVPAAGLGHWMCE